MIEIGLFREICKDDRLPSIFSAIRNNPPENKEKILAYMKRAAILACAPGWACDVIDGGSRIGSLLCYSDGTYVWRSDIIYYFDKYNIELPADFVNHVLKESV